MKYHVVFLGKPVSRAWLQSDGVRPFVGDNKMNDETSVRNAANLLASSEFFFFGFFFLL